MFCVWSWLYVSFLCFFSSFPIILPKNKKLVSLLWLYICFFVYVFACVLMPYPCIALNNILFLLYTYKSLTIYMISGPGSDSKLKACRNHFLWCVVCDFLLKLPYVYCIFVTFQCGILGQVWYLIVLFPDLCRLSYFDSMINDCHIPKSYMSRDMRFPTMWYVRPAKPQISLRICAV